MAVNAPEISVIVPAWGVSPWLAEALRSLQAQTRPDWEAIVVDDGDAVPVAAALHPFAGDQRIRLLATDNVGLAGARNRGIAAARAARIALLDGDDRYMPDYLERMAGLLDGDPGAGFVTCDAVMFGTPAFEGKLFSALEPQNGEITLERVMRGQFKVFGAAMVRRSALDAVGGYDPSLRSAEDLDLWLRLLEAGWRGRYAAAPLYEYRRRAGSLSAASLSLAGWVRQVYANAAARLEGRPEQAVAQEMLAAADNQLRIEQGLAMLLAGDGKAGLARLRSTDIAGRSPKWRAAMRAFRLFPLLAAPTVRFYMRRNPFAGRDAAAKIEP